MASIEIDAIHSFNGGEICDLLSSLRIHDKHLRRRTCADKQSVRSFVKGSVTIPLAVTGQVDTTARLLVSTT